MRTCCVSLGWGCILLYTTDCDGRGVRCECCHRQYISVRHLLECGAPCIGGSDGGVTCRQGSRPSTPTWGVADPCCVLGCSPHMQLVVVVALASLRRLAVHRTCLAPHCRDVFFSFSLVRTCTGPIHDVVCWACVPYLVWFFPLVLSVRLSIRTSSAQSEVEPCGG